MTPVPVQDFETNFLGDKTLTDILKHLCTPIQKATQDSLVAVIYDCVLEKDGMRMETPNRVLMGDQRAKPWYALVAENRLSETSTRMLAQAYLRQSSHWCLSLSEQMDAMHTEEQQRFSLYLTATHGVLRRDNGDEDDIGDFDSFDDYVQSYVSLAFPPTHSCHEKMTSMEFLPKARELAEFITNIHLT